jgi:hypothetical protein
MALKCVPLNGVVAARAVCGIRREGIRTRANGVKLYLQ